MLDKVFLFCFFESTNLFVDEIAIQTNLFCIYFNIMYGGLCSRSRQQKQTETPN